MDFRSLFASIFRTSCRWCVENFVQFLNSRHHADSSSHQRRCRSQHGFHEFVVCPVSPHSVLASTKKWIFAFFVTRIALFLPSQPLEALSEGDTNMQRPLHVAIHFNFDSSYLYIKFENCAQRNSSKLFLSATFLWLPSRSIEQKRRNASIHSHLRQPVPAYLFFCDLRNGNKRECDSWIATEVTERANKRIKKKDMAKNVHVPIQM